MASYKIDFQVTATDTNVYKCVYIWHRLVSNNNTVQGITNWAVDTFSNTGGIYVFSEYLTNLNLKFCDNIFLEVYIMPCCSVVDLLQNIDCTTCTSLPSNTPLPNVIPSTAIHQYYEVDLSLIANDMFTYNNPAKLAVIPSSLYTQYQRLRITCESGCVLGSDINCSAVVNNQHEIYLFSTSGQSDIKFYYCNNTLTVEGYNGTNWVNITSSITSQPFYLDNSHCMFDDVLIGIRNKDTKEAYVTAQLKTGQLVNITIQPNQTVAACVKRDTWYVENRNNVIQNLVYIEVLSSC